MGPGKPVQSGRGPAAVTQREDPRKATVPRLDGVGMREVMLGSQKTYPSSLGDWGQVFTFDIFANAKMSNVKT